jgi:anti-sigma factor RsiW
MNCRDFHEALYAFVAEELPAEAAEEVNGHLHVCPPCAALVQSYRITIGLARRLPPDSLTPVCQARLRSSLAPFLRPE